MKIIKRIITDTLQENNGKWSIKRLAGISAFYFAIVYLFIPYFAPEFIVHEFAFWGLLTFSGGAIGLTVWNKKIDKE
jgi:hypothetical protein